MASEMPYFSVKAVSAAKLGRNVELAVRLTPSPSSDALGRVAVMERKRTRASEAGDRNGFVRRKTGAG